MESADTYFFILFSVQGDVEGATFDLTPGAADLDASQQFIDSIQRTSTQEFLGETKFQKIFPKSAPFFVNASGKLAITL